MMRPLSLLLCALLLASPAPAEELTGTSPPDGVRIESGQSARVEAHNVCRNVANNTGAPVMIPHRTPQEWAVGGGAFLSNPYPNLTVSPCLATTVYDVGTCAIGASGNRIVLTLLHELARRGGGLGAAALCGGGGQGDALLVRTV